MGANQKRGIDFKLLVVGKYERGKCGYKRLAREFNLSRDTVRDWCLNPRLQSAIQMAKKKKVNAEEKDLEYYKTTALFWETYAKNIEEELAKQGKKKLLLKAMLDCLEKRPETKVRKLCEAAGGSKSAFYYNRSGASRKGKDEETLTLLKSLPERILLRRGSKAKAKPLQKLCADVSYFRTSEGWLFLSLVLDLFNNKIVCRAVSARNDDALAAETLDRLLSLGPLEGALLHSDQGALYTAKSYRKRLKKSGVVQSMSRRGNCWDNACMEHFFGTLKVESGYDDLLKSGGRLSFEGTKKLIDNFIEYYNNERVQQKLG